MEVHETCQCLTNILAIQNKMQELRREQAEGKGALSDGHDEAGARAMVQAQLYSTERVLPRTQMLGPNGTGPFSDIPPWCAYWLQPGGLAFTPRL